MRRRRLLTPPPPLPRYRSPGVSLGWGPLTRLGAPLRAGAHLGRGAQALPLAVFADTMQKHPDERGVKGGGEGGMSKCGHQK